MMREIKTSSFSNYQYYRHFKGLWYMVLHIAEHTETGEGMIVYQACYGDRKVYARPYEMFASKVDRDKYPDAEQDYRFMSIDELKDIFGSGIVQEMISNEME